MIIYKNPLLRLVLLIFLLSFLIVSCANQENSGSSQFSKTSENTTIHKLTPYNGVLLTAAYFAPNLHNNKPPYASFILEGSSSSPSISVSEADFKASLSSNYLDMPFEFDESLKIKAEVDAKLRAPLEVEAPAPILNFKTAPNFKTDIAIGDKWNDIYVLKDIERNYRQTLINATCKKVSKHAYFFVEDGYSVDGDILNEIAADFDKHYQTLVNRFATPNDIDGNGKPSFLITKINSSSIMGFFYSVDMHPRGTRFSGNVISNGADMLYINIGFLSRDLWNKDKDRIIATFFHELQHMTFHSYRTNNNLKDMDDSWLNEGMSMLAEYYCGHPLSHSEYIISFLRNRMHDSMTNASFTDYGYYLLFLRYLQEQFGTDIQQKIYASRKTIGFEMVEDATGMPFTEVYADFVKAVLLSGRAVIDTNVSDYKKYQIDNWTMSIGSAEYQANGFNLKDILDTVISSKRSTQNSKYYITTSGYSVNNMNYNSFFFTRWQNNIGDISFSSDYANLFYAVVEP